jgi:hypothetical protein
MGPPLLGRDCAWCVKASVELIGRSPVVDMHTQVEPAALRRYFSLGRKGCDCRRAAKTTRHRWCARKLAECLLARLRASQSASLRSQHALVGRGTITCICGRLEQPRKPEWPVLAAQSGRCPSMFHNNCENRVLRAVTTTDSCDTSGGNPEGTLFAFTDALY